LNYVADGYLRRFRDIRSTSALARRKRPKSPTVVGWGARTRTWEWRNQNPLPYHLATPQFRNRPLGGWTIAAPQGTINVADQCGASCPGQGATAASRSRRRRGFAPSRHRAATAGRPAQ